MKRMAGWQRSRRSINIWRHRKAAAKIISSAWRRWRSIAMAALAQLAWR